MRVGGMAGTLGHCICGDVYEIDLRDMGLNTFLGLELLALIKASAASDASEELCGTTDENTKVFLQPRGKDSSWRPHRSPSTVKMTCTVKSQRVMRVKMIETG